MRGLITVLILTVALTWCAAAQAADDRDARSMGLAGAGNAQMNYIEEAPLLENVAGAVQTDGSGGAAGASVGYIKVSDADDEFSDQTLAASPNAKYLLLVRDFTKETDRYGGRLVIGISFDYEFDYQTSERKAGDLDTEFTTVSHYPRVRPLVAYGIIDQLALGVGVDLAKNYSTVTIDDQDEGEYDYELDYDFTYSPTVGLLVTPHPRVQIGAKFDLGYLSEQEVTIEAGDQERDMTFYASVPRVLGGGVCVDFPAFYMTAWALDVDYVFETEKDDIKVVLPMLDISSSLEKRLDDAYVMRVGGRYQVEQEESGWVAYSVSIGFSGIKQYYNYNLALYSTFRRNPDLDLSGHEIRLAAGVAF